VPNLEKRIKRHVIGPEHLFFAATAPGLEPICLQELSGSPLSIPNARIVSGGVEFNGRLGDGYRANLHLHTANRILMRIAGFKATHFRRLQDRLEGIPWELYVDPEAERDIRVTSRRSRLYHSGAVREVVARSLSERFPEPATGSHRSADRRRAIFFIRVEEDRFTLSLDTSGELLYKRGIKTGGGRAPIRETLAAAILKLAGFPGEGPLVDPLCGTGTFSIEAALLARNIPAGWFRDFAFMQWPGFRPRQYAYLRKIAGTKIADTVRPAIFARDQDPEAIERLKICLEAAGLTDSVAAAQGDFFDLTPAEMGCGPGLVVINPPYGRRIGNRIESQNLFTAICRKLRLDFKGWKIALILPPGLGTGRVPFHLTSRRFRHGGLGIEVGTGKIE
jgi:putative N6-adenine-specific DNA methylase